MKNFILFVCLLVAMPSLSMRVDLKSNAKTEEKSQLKKLLKLISNSHSPSLEEFLKKLDTCHIKNRVLNIFDPQAGLYPLHYALAQRPGSYDIIKLLLAHGAEPNKPIRKRVTGKVKDNEISPYLSDEGITPAHVAVIKGQPLEILYLLQHFGCDFSGHHLNSLKDIATRTNNQKAMDFMNLMSSNLPSDTSHSVYRLNSSNFYMQYNVQFIEVKSGEYTQGNPVSPKPFVNYDDDMDDCCCSCTKWCGIALRFCIGSLRHAFSDL